MKTWFIYRAPYVTRQATIAAIFLGGDAFHK